MNNEPQDWLQLLETAAHDVEQFMKDTAETVAETADIMMQVPIAIAEQVEEAIATEVDQFLEDVLDWLQPPVQVTLRFDLEWHGEGLEPWVESVEPGQGLQASCVGCRHYHGRVYGDNLLVCGMHPYGWDGTDCPDWESKS